jgi:hypothetical protein
MIIHHNTSHRIGSSYVAPLPVEKPVTLLSMYLDTLTPMPRAKAETALLKHVRFDGNVMRRHQFAERLVNNNARYDDTRKRMYHGNDGHFYDLSALTVTMVHYIAWLQSRI